MLSSSTSSRPRPPAQARRTSSSKSPDDRGLPPPYPDKSDSLASSSSSRRIVETVTTTTTSSTRTMTIVADDQIPSPTELRPAVNDVLHGRSREELQEMLLAAHNIIKRHEQELTKASSEAQCLREQNIAMKTQFDKLSTRRPQSPAVVSSLSRSRSNSFLSSQDVGDVAGTPPISPRKFNTPLRGHRSRQSIASPIALAQLADQNAELVSKLDQLQEETNSLDQAGKRKLKKLEKEIDVLKDELEQVQKRNAELEKERIEKEKQTRKNEEEQEKRKHEREEKARLIRESVKHNSDDGRDDQIRDFAPSSSSNSIASFNSPARRSRVSSTHGGRPIPFDLELSAIISAAEPSLDGMSAPGTVRSIAPPAETAIVIQLLAKIEELEEANREFIRRRAETEAKFKSASEGINSMRLAYQEIEDEIELAEFDDDFDEGEEHEEEGEWVDEGPHAATMTFRLGSLRSIKSSDVMTSTIRNGNGESPIRPLRNRSSKGSLRSLPRSSPRGSGNLRMLGKRARKPLTQNMFVSPPTSPSNGGSPAIPQVPVASGSNGLLAPPVVQGRPGRDRFAAVDFSRRNSIAESGQPPYSTRRSSIPPAPSLRNVPSFGDMGRYMGALGLASPGAPKRTLENELLGEYGPEWTLNSADINRQMFDTSYQDGTTASADASFISNAGTASAYDDALGMHPNPAIIALQSALDPANRGRLLEDDEHILPVGCLRDSPADTFYGLEEAVAARPSRWIDVHSAQPLLITANETVSATSSPVQAASQMRRLLSGAPEYDPWDATIYGSDLDQVDVAEDDDGAGSTSSLKGKEKDQESDWGNLEAFYAKRDSALMRLDNTMRTRRRHSFTHSDDGSTADNSLEVVEEDTPADVSKYDPKALAARLRHSALEKTFLEVWLILQFVMVLAVFVYSSVRQGPRAVMHGPGAGPHHNRRAIY